MTASMRDWVQPFARSISAKVSALDLPLDKKQRCRLRESMGDDIRKCSDCIVPEASKAALEKAAALGIDLYAMDWHDQRHFDAGRVQFHLEHVFPVRMIREECIAAVSEGAILDVLLTRPRVAWILKSENATLDCCGYRQKRDPDAAYKEAGIELVPCVAIDGIVS